MNKAVGMFQATSEARTLLLKRVQFFALGIWALVFAVAIVLIRIGILRPIDNAIGAMDEGAGQVNDHSAHLSAASQRLVEGAGEQAAALEETGAILQEMARTARRNAEGAHEANSLSGQAEEACTEGETTVRRLSEAMTNINEASGEIGQIVKTIEEIAFQTNLLALNAAVEAARAGEHGKGFAVVAEEVRNLAQRAAGAARETTNLIQDSVSRIDGGVVVVGEVETVFDGIKSNVDRISAVVEEIAKASQQQATGVEQVGTGIREMDQVTQQNAASSEEIAAASEELTAMSLALKDQVVGDLVGLVQGSKRDSERRAVVRQGELRGVYAGQSMSLTVRTHDRSMSGLSVTSPEPLDLGSRCSLMVRSDNGGTESLKGKVARCDRSPQGGWIIGVEYEGAGSMSDVGGGISRGTESRTAA